MEIKAYLDNVIVCGIVRGDLASTQMAAVQEIEAAAKRGQLNIVTSREAWREQDRTQNADLRSEFENERASVPIVQDDHRMLGSRAQCDSHGQWYATCPILTEVVDDALFAASKRAGLKDADARHFMYAVHNGCNRFVTTDPHFLDRLPQLHALSRGMLIQRPSDLAAELRGLRSADSRGSESLDGGVLSG
jgi:predicted nucleic acid-binding protein